MKREEKIQLTKRKIIGNALEEFSRNGYGISSINNIYDSRQGISKGIIYHYFSSKDELFLACVEECFKSLKSYIQIHFVPSSGTMTAEEYFTGYFAARMNFFREHPLYQRIFIEAVFIPPEHLKSEILNLRQPMEIMNIEILENILSQIPLRVSLDKTEAVKIFIHFINFINLQYHAEGKNITDIQSFEEKNKQILDIFLNGIAERQDK